MTISDKHFALLWGDALGYDGERDAWVSDHALGWEQNTDDPYQDPVDIDSDEFRARLTYLSRLWELAHMSIRDICTEAHITMAALSARTTIPYRTLQNWASGTNRFPGYDRLLILHYLGLMPTL